ncbi:MAG: 2-hydroxy-3-oxopropionate reductase [uncultured Thermomicrobiales bacterium]|uniref:2-hydroxy-3-oxopropionate reductase n=1 Tax=uncultured Thermomicrobiales bacterium TaxID=1645740 RepID=A0A6J4VN80_9BACT|nr:MAG: 2-hydroxy-3-oxopropionate reductase [uncultured Thermomicrobiales bacterium]
MTDTGQGATIGFIGLGIMGRPMARNLAAAGFRLRIHNRSQAAVDELVAEHDAFLPAGSPRAVAEACDIVITMLPDTPDVERVITGEDGIIAAARPGLLVIDMSTIAPGATIQLGERLASHGASLLDAPVSGGDKGAIAGTLSIMVGGSADDFARAQPLFQAMGTTIVHVGDSGAGQTVKMCNQIAVAINLAGVSEALVLGARAGVDPQKIIEVLSGGLAASRVMELKAAAMVGHTFAPGFRVELHRKDLRIARAAASAQHVALPVSAVVTELFESLAATGHDTDDHSSIVTAIERLSGFSLTAGLADGSDGH